MEDGGEKTDRRKPTTMKEKKQVNNRIKKNNRNDITHFNLKMMRKRDATVTVKSLFKLSFVN